MQGVRQNSRSIQPDRTGQLNLLVSQGPSLPSHPLTHAQERTGKRWAACRAGESTFRFSLTQVQADLQDNRTESQMCSRMRHLLSSALSQALTVLSPLLMALAKASLLRIQQGYRQLLTTHPLPEHPVGGETCHPHCPWMIDPGSAHGERVSPVASSSTSGPVHGTYKI